MASQNSHNDNQVLASKFGDLLENEIHATEIEDPLFDTLTMAKNELLLDVDAPGKDKVWKNISTEIHSSAGKKTETARIFNLNSVQRWTVAAAVVIAAFIGIYTTIFSSQEELLYQTAEAKASVTLQDGSEVTLRPYSKLYETDRNRMEVTYRLEGEAYFEVTKAKDRRFAVIAGNGKVTVLGTRFNLSTWGKQVQVFLEEGSIEFENIQTKERMLLSPGEAARISESTSLEFNQAVDSEEFTDWKKDILVFKNRDITTIVQELEQQFNIRVTLTEDLKSITLSGELNLNNPQQALDYLALTLEGSFEKVSDNSYRFVSSTN